MSKTDLISALESIKAKAWGEFRKTNDSFFEDAHMFIGDMISDLESDFEE